MATVNYSFVPQAGYTGDYEIKVYKLTTDLEVNSEVKSSPHANPVVGSLFVATVEPYYVKVFAVDCDNKLVAMDIYYPEEGTCTAPGAPSFTDITDTTADATWAAPGGTEDSFTWFLYKFDDAELVEIDNGTVVPAAKDLTGLTKNTKYRLLIYSNCGADHSSSVYNDFETTGPEINGSVELAGGDDVSVTIRSTTNMNEYGIDGEVGDRQIPFDEYEIIAFNNGGCGGATIDPPLFSTFVLDAGNDTVNIEIVCP